MSCDADPTDGPFVTSGVTSHGQHTHIIELTVENLSVKFLIHKKFADRLYPLHRTIDRLWTPNAAFND